MLARTSAAPLIWGTRQRQTRRKTGTQSSGATAREFRVPRRPSRRTYLRRLLHMSGSIKNAPARTLVATLAFALACTGSDTIAPAKPGTPTESAVTVTITAAVDSLRVGQSQLFAAQATDDRK